MLGEWVAVQSPISDLFRFKVQMLQSRRVFTSILDSPYFGKVAELVSNLRHNRQQLVGKIRTITMSLKLKHVMEAKQQFKGCLRCIKAGKNPPFAH